MKIKNTLRIPIGFAASVIFFIRAEPNIWSFCIGTAIILFGELIRFISAGTLIKFEGVTSCGIYNYSRNPLYIGSFFIGIGACVIGKDIIFSIFFLIAYPLLYLQTIKNEERYLLKRYGEDYEKYIRTVPRFWSGRMNIGEILKGSSPFLAVKNRELMSIVGVVTVIVMMAAKMIY